MKTLKKSILCIIVAVIFTTSVGCFGRFQATRNLYTWNDNAVRSNFGKTLLFYVLGAVQVYSVFGAADLFIFNLIEFWTGRNPLSLNDGEYEYQNIHLNGQDYLLTASKNQIDIHILSQNTYTHWAKINYTPDNNQVIIEKQQLQQSNI